MADDERRAPAYRAVTQYFDEEARRYDSIRTRNAYQRRKWTAELKAVETSVARLVGPRDVVLDAPIGTGRALASIRSSGARAIGLDVSTDMLAQASMHAEQLTVPLVAGSVEAIPLRDASVDLVVCLRLFQHLPESVVLAALDEFIRVSRRGVLVQVPLLNRASPLVRWLGTAIVQRTLRPRVRRPAGRMLPVSRSQLEAWLRTHGMVLRASSVVTWRLGQLRLLHVTADRSEAPRSQ